MGFFDFFKRSGASAAPATPDQMRDALFGAVLSGKGRELDRLCRTHRDAIAQHFPAWQKPPEELRSNPEAMQRYVNGLIGVAQFFADSLGDASLIERLMGPPESNPLVQWQNRLAEARELMDGLRYAEATQALSDLLIDVRELKGSGADRYQPITLGYLGECYFHQGEPARALPHLEQALRLCEQSGDGAGVAAYLDSLYEVHRYLGQGPAAAAAAERLATALAGQGRTQEATRYRRQAAVVRAGEPLNRVVAVVNGQQYELDEVPATRSAANLDRIPLIVRQ